MSYTILIKKDGWESLLEIKVQDEILEQEPLVLSLLKDCFEKVFQFIKKEKEEVFVNTELEDVDLSE